MAGIQRCPARGYTRHCPSKFGYTGPALGLKPCPLFGPMTALCQPPGAGANSLQDLPLSSAGQQLPWIAKFIQNFATSFRFNPSNPGQTTELQVYQNFIFYILLSPGTSAISAQPLKSKEDSRHSSSLPAPFASFERSATNPKTGSARLTAAITNLFAQLKQSPSQFSLSTSSDNAAMVKTAHTEIQHHRLSILEADSSKRSPSFNGLCVDPARRLQPLLVTIPVISHFLHVLRRDLPQQLRERTERESRGLRSRQRRRIQGTLVTERKSQGRKGSPGPSG